MDVKQIKNDFIRVIEHSQGIEDPQIEELFENWLSAKRDIIEAFGGELIYEVPETVHFHLDDKKRTAYFNDFVNHVNQTYQNEELAHFLNLNKDGFYDNIVANAYEHCDIKIPKGMKLVKAFKFFETDKKALTTLQNEASQLIQEDRIEGKLCFSVHPLDFLSVSVNTYNWRSCHALDGEYRAGNLSYMSDASTIVCYLKGADNQILPCFPNDVLWNSKKWRVLFFLSENWDLIFASKQYPFTAAAGLDVALEHLKKALKLEKCDMPKWQNDYVSDWIEKSGAKATLRADYLPFQGRLYALDDIIEEDSNALQFNDLLRSSTYHKPYYVAKDNHWWADTHTIPKVRIGRQVKCLCCEDRNIRNSEFMACNQCVERWNLYLDDESYVCDCCGMRLFNDDEYFCIMGEILCERCYDENVFTCPCCEREFFTDYQRYDKKHEQFVCIECYENRGEY